MTSVEKKLCYFAYNIAFKNQHLISGDCECKNIEKLKSDPALAAWFVTECMAWGFTDNVNRLAQYILYKDTNNSYIVVNTNGTAVRIDFFNGEFRYEISEAKKTTITIDLWE